GPSAVPIPLHFAFADEANVDVESAGRIKRPLRDVFDVPDLALMDDAIVNGTYQPVPGEALPLAPFTAPRADYSLFRLPHYTAASPQHFQNFISFTSYQFYSDSIIEKARRMIASGESGYASLVEPGNVITLAGSKEPSSGRAPERLPQMPAYHLTRPGHSG